MERKIHVNLICYLTFLEGFTDFSLTQHFVTCHFFSHVFRFCYSIIAFTGF